jgi:hypothetical protein
MKGSENIFESYLLRCCVLYNIHGNVRWIDQVNGKHQEDYKDFLKDNFSSLERYIIEEARKKEIQKRKVAIEREYESICSNVRCNYDVNAAILIYCAAVFYNVSLVVYLAVLATMYCCCVSRIAAKQSQKFDQYWLLLLANIGIEAERIEKGEQEKFFAYYILKMIEEENNTKLLGMASLKEKCKKILDSSDPEKFIINEAKIAVKEITGLSDKEIELHFCYSNQDNRLCRVLKNLEQAKLCSKKNLEIFKPAYKIMKEFGLDSEFQKKLRQLWKKADVRESKEIMRAMSLCTKASLETIPLASLQGLPQELQKKIFNYAI